MKNLVDDYKNAKRLIEASEEYEKLWRRKADFLNERMGETASSATWANRERKARELIKQVEQGLFAAVAAEPDTNTEEQELDTFDEENYEPDSEPPKENS